MEDMDIEEFRGMVLPPEDKAVVEEPKPKPKPKAKPSTIVVGSRDTWSRLAARAKVDATDLAAANHMTTRSNLHAGTTLRVP